MTFSIDRLPYDVLYGVCLYLNIEEVVHLSNTCRQLSILLTEETLCRRLIEVSLRRG